MRNISLFADAVRRREHCHSVALNMLFLPRET